MCTQSDTSRLVSRHFLSPRTSALVPTGAKRPIPARGRPGRRRPSRAVSGSTLPLVREDRPKKSPPKLNLCGRQAERCPGKWRRFSGPLLQRHHRRCRWFSRIRGVNRGKAGSKRKEPAAHRGRRRARRGSGGSGCGRAKGSGGHTRSRDASPGGLRYAERGVSTDDGTVLRERHVRLRGHHEPGG